MACTKLFSFGLLASAPLAIWLGTGSADATAAAAAAVQEASEGAGQAGPPAPGPEHKILERWVGEWDCETTVSMAPGEPPAVSKGTSSSRLTCGGLWLVTDYESTLMEQPFIGHHVVGFDPGSGKYQLNWVDSMSTRFSLGEGTFDAATKTMTSHVKSFDPAGTPWEWRETDVWKDADTREWTMYAPGPDGSEIVMVHIVYKRRK